MAGKNAHFSNASVFFTLLIAGFVLFFLPRSFSSRINLLFCDTFAFALRAGRQVPDTATELQDIPADAVSQEEYVRLWKSYHNLRAQMMALHDEYERLSNVRVGLPQLSEEGLVMAKVTSDLGNYSHEVVIDKGSLSAIRPGQYVLSERNDTLIGVVRDCSETVSKVRLITDAKQSIEVHVRREDSEMDFRAMMIGNGDETCSISMVDKNRDVRAGDTVYAAAVPRVLPVPLVIGKIINVQADDKHPLLWKITVGPAEDMSRLDNVSIIIGNSKLLNRKD